MKKKSLHGIMKYIILMKNYSTLYESYKIKSIDYFYLFAKDDNVGKS